MKKVFLFIFLSFFVSFVFIGINDMNKAYANEEISKQLKETSLKKINVYNESYDKVNNYYLVYNEWIKTKFLDGHDTHIISALEVNGGTLYTANQSYEYSKNTVYMEPNDSISFTIDINDPGLYEIYFDYYVTNDTKINPKISIDINGEKQFSEMNSVGLNVDWKIENKVYFDRYGDELTPKSIIFSKWYMNEALTDPNYFFVKPLKFNFKSGLNEIKIILNEGYLLLGDIKITNELTSIPSYAEYKNEIKKEKTSIKSLTTIEAEDMSYKSRQSIRAKYMRDPQVTPYQYKNRVLNVLDGYSYGESGDSVTYTFNVEETGYYNVAVKYYLNTNNGLPSNRRISIDGEVPFSELENYSFTYKSNWKNEVLNLDGKAFDIYLEKGTHTISLAVDNVKIRDIYHGLLGLLGNMQSISKEINKITGGLEDKERDWEITTYIPNLKENLTFISNQLDLQIQNLKAYANNENIPVIFELKIAKKLIDEFVNDPEDLPSYMSKFTKGEKSAYGRINTILPTLIYNPLHMDKLYIYNDVHLPKANANIFIKFVEGIKAFFYSFFDQKYNETAKLDEDTIEIWVNKSRLYVEIMQRMIDEDFTPKTGIKVQLSIMPDENKIILSNAAHSTPDGIIGISFQKPFELAIRGVTEDLSQYEGFYNLAEEYNPSTFIPYIYDNGVYAMPETQDVKLLFYRKDILSTLGVQPPETWDEVISLVPVLQKYDMNFFVPIGEENAYKGLDKTTPFIYQYGGNLYNSNKMTTSINQDGAYTAFEVMTDLFTVYNLPVTTSNFFQHFRSGVIPVG